MEFIGPSLGGWLTPPSPRSSAVQNRGKATSTRPEEPWPSFNLARRHWRCLRTRGAPCFAAEQLEAAQHLGAGLAGSHGYEGLIVGRDGAEQLAGDHLQRKVDTHRRHAEVDAQFEVRSQRRGEADSLRGGARGGAPARARGRGRAQARGERLNADLASRS